MNQGVIAGLFTSGVIFSSLFFYLLYNERINLLTAAGMASIIAGVVCVGTSDSERLPFEQDHLIWAVFFALLSGVLIGLNGVIFRFYVVKVGYSALQLNIDGFMWSGLALSFLFGHAVYFEAVEYSARDLTEGVFAAFLSMGGVYSLARAYVSGRGGPIQAIDSLKCLIPLFLNFFFYAILPTSLQFAGVALSIGGAALVACGQGK